MPTATIMPGTMIGERMKPLISRLPANLPRTSPNAAGVPSAVARMVTQTATQMLSQAAPRQSARPKNLAYHCKEKPGGGKLRYLAAEKETGMITRIGKIR